MKKLKLMIIGVFSVFMMSLLTGCTDQLTVEKMTLISRSAGMAAGAVCKISTVDANSLTALTNILVKVSASLPTQTKTFVDTWNPIIVEDVSKFVSSGKLTESQASIIKTAMVAIEEGLDYLFTVRYPEAKQSIEFVSAGITGFKDGFISTISPVSETLSLSPIDYEEYAKALEYFRPRFKAVNVKQ